MLEETDRLFTCGFCRVQSYLVRKDFFRYTLPDAAPRGKELIFFPYWRFKGMFFSCSPGGVRHRFMDLSYQALESTRFPVSVGFRSQALKLRFLSPDTPGRCLSPTFSLPRVMEIFYRRFTDSLPKPSLYQSHIGESVSLIYAPYYVDRKLHDAVVNKPISAHIDPSEISGLPGGPPDWKIEFTPTLCPHCGWDMEGERDSRVMHCRNCNSAWQGGKEGFRQIRFAHMPSEGDNLLFMPFWRIRADISGIRLTSYADLIKIANLPRAIREGDEKIGFRFWAPAFKVRPRTYLRLMTQVTLSQPREKLEERLPDARFYPVNVPEGEATESMKINLATFMKPQERLMERLPGIRIQAGGSVLVYLPFVEKHHDLIQLDFQVSINKNQLRHAGNL